jgi:hypothetical protein
MSERGSWRTVNVKLIYFKASGKYYSEGDINLETTDFYSTIKTIRQLREEGNLPGLVRGAKDFIILITREDMSLPHLLPIEKESRERDLPLDESKGDEQAE